MRSPRSHCGHLATVPDTFAARAASTGSCPNARLSVSAPARDTPDWYAMLRWIRFRVSASSQERGCPWHRARGANGLGLRGVGASATARPRPGDHDGRLPGPQQRPRWAGGRSYTASEEASRNSEVPEALPPIARQFRLHARAVSQGPRLEARAHPVARPVPRLAPSTPRSSSPPSKDQRAYV